MGIGLVYGLIPKYSQIRNDERGEAVTIRASICSIMAPFTILGFAASAYADISCEFKSEELVDVTIIVHGKSIWTGTLEKGETKAVTIPEGTFTVVSKVFNANLDRKGDIRGTSHTNDCKGNHVIAVPLFSSGP